MTLQGSMYLQSWLYKKVKRKCTNIFLVLEIVLTIESWWWTVFVWFIDRDGKGIDSCTLYGQSNFYFISNIKKADNKRERTVHTPT